MALVRKGKKKEIFSFEKKKKGKVSLSLFLGAPSLSGTGAVFGSLSFHLSFVFLLPFSFRFQSNGYRFYPGLGYLKNRAKIEISVFLA